MPPNQMSMEELQAELEMLKSRKIKVTDLPIESLRRKLAQELANPTETILPNSIGPELIAESALFDPQGIMKACTADFVLTESYATPTGMELTLPADGHYLIITNLDLESAAGTFVYTGLQVDSSFKGEQFKSQSGRFPVPVITWQEDLTQGSGVAVKVKRGAGSGMVRQAHSRLIALRLGG